MITPLYPWSSSYRAECLARRHQVPFFESLVWFDLGLNPGLPDHWRVHYSLCRWPIAPYLLIICLDYVLRTLIKKNGFTLKKQVGSRHYFAEAITYADYIDDLALLANTPTQAESLLQSLKQAAGGIVLHVNANKTEYIRFKRERVISSLNGGSLKLVDKLMHLGSSVSSTESDVNMGLAKSSTAIDWLSIIWMPDLSDKIKRNFFQAAVAQSAGAVEYTDCFSPPNNCTGMTLNNQMMGF